MIILFALVALFLILHLNLPRDRKAAAKPGADAPGEIQYSYTGRLPRRLRALDARPLPPFLVRMDGLRMAA